MYVVRESVECYCVVIRTIPYLCRYSQSPEGTLSSSVTGDTPLHKVVLGAVKEVFKVSVII